MYVFPEMGGKPEKMPIPASELEKQTRCYNVLVPAAESERRFNGKIKNFEKGNLDEELAKD